MTFKPMLSAKADPTQLKYPLLSSPKLDGIRAIVRSGMLYSRNMKLIPNRYCQKLLGKNRFNGLDGELIVGSPYGDNVYRDTMSGVMSADGTPDVTFYVFDYIALNLPYKKRLLEAAMRIGGIGGLKELGHVVLHNEEELLTYEKVCLRMGYEGIVLRDPNGFYKYGRSTLREGALMKLKRFEDSEAVIIDCAELYHNENEAKEDELGRQKRSSHKANKIRGGTLGALRVQDLTTNVEFEVGSGFDDTMRTLMWKDYQHDRKYMGLFNTVSLPAPLILGKIIKYKYFAGGSYDKPRFPVFLGFREAIDL